MENKKKIKIHHEQEQISYDEHDHYVYLKHTDKLS